MATPATSSTRLRLASGIAAGTALFSAFGLAPFLAFAGETGQPWTPALFIAGYALAVVALAPAGLLAIAAGALFGVPHGVLYSFVGGAVGSTAAFLVARHLIRPALARRQPCYASVAALDRAIEKRERILVILMRLSPVVPSNLLNYGLGISRVSLTNYMLGFVAMLPGSLLWVSYGSLLRIMMATGREVSPTDGPAPIALLVVGVAATTALLSILTRTIRGMPREAPAS